MGKVAGAQHFDGQNWYKQHIAKRTREALDEQDQAFAVRHAESTLMNWPAICGVVLSIGINLRLLVRSSAEATLPSGSEAGQKLYGLHI